MYMLKGVFGSEIHEMILMYLYVSEGACDKSISEFFSMPSGCIRTRLGLLEQDGVIISSSIDNVRSYRLNPNYPFLKQLKGLLHAALAMYPADVAQRLKEKQVRARPDNEITQYEQQFANSGFGDDLLTLEELLEGTSKSDYALPDDIVGWQTASPVGREV